MNNTGWRTHKAVLACNGSSLPIGPRACPAFPAKQPV